MKARKLHDLATGAVYGTTKVITNPRCGCGKQGYTSKKVAKMHAAIARRDFGEPIIAYRCTAPRAHWWHIGHPPGWHYQQHRSEAS